MTQPLPAGGAAGNRVGRLILVVGNSGVGKTTFAERLAEAGGFSVGLEQHAGRPFQARFAQELARYALANQVDYLLFRAEQERRLRAGEGVAIQDGGLEQDFFVFTRHFFRKGYLQADEFALCERLYSTLRSLLPAPDLILRLAAPVEACMQRYTRRGRALEIARRAELVELETLLDEWLNGTVQPLVQYIPIITIDASADDPRYAAVLPAAVAHIHALLKA